VSDSGRWSGSLRRYLVLVRRHDRALLAVRLQPNPRMDHELLNVVTCPPVLVCSTCDRPLRRCVNLPQRRLLRSALTDALFRLFGSHCRKLSLIVTLLLCLSPDIPLLPRFLSSLFSVTHCLASAPLKLWRYINTFIIIIITTTIVY